MPQYNYESVKRDLEEIKRKLVTIEENIKITNIQIGEIKRE